MLGDRVTSSAYRWGTKVQRLKVKLGPQSKTLQTWIGWAFTMNVARPMHSRHSIRCPQLQLWVLDVSLKLNPSNQVTRQNEMEHGMNDHLWKVQCLAVQRNSSAQAEFWYSRTDSSYLSMESSSFFQQALQYMASKCWRPALFITDSSLLRV